MKKRVYSPRLRRYVTRCASYGAGRITDPRRMLGPGLFGRGGSDRPPPSKRGGPGGWPGATPSFFR